MNRTIVITGGTSGIGLALKEKFEKKGDKVITFSIDESDNPNHYQGSVAHEIKVNQVFNDIFEKHGKIDMLINCAGFGMSAITEIAPMDKITAVMDVNFYGTLYCSRAALRYMSEGARIVNMSSAMALFPVPFKSIYGAAKSAVLSLSFAMKMELAPAGIDVVAICPGDTKTNFTKNRIKEFETTERYGDRLKNATEHHESKENKRMSVKFVANQIYRLINKKKTKPFYIVGGKYKMLYFLTRLTPKSLLINMTGKKLGGIVDKPVNENAVATQEETTVSTMQETTMFTALNNNLETAEETPVTEVPVEETQTEELAIADAPVENAEEQPAEVMEETLVASNNTEEDDDAVAEEVSVEPTTEEPVVAEAEQEATGFNNILNKISTLNRPTEQTAEVETMVEDNVNIVADEPAEEVEPEVVQEPEEEPTSVIFEEDEEDEETAEPVEAEEIIEEVSPVKEEAEEITPVVFEEETEEVEEQSNPFATFGAVAEEQDETPAGEEEVEEVETAVMFEEESEEPETTFVEEAEEEVLEENEEVEETPALAEEPQEEPAPAEEKPRLFSSFDALRQSISNMQRPAPVAEPEETPVVVADDTEETQEVEEDTITAETSVFASAEEPATTHIQFSDEEDDRLN